MKVLSFSGSQSRKKIACFFSERISNQERVLLVEAACASRNIPEAFGVQDECIYDLEDYLRGVVELYKAAVEYSDELHIVPAPMDDEKKITDDGKLDRLISDAETEYEVLVLDLEEPFYLSSEYPIERIIVQDQESDVLKVSYTYSLDSGVVIESDNSMVEEPDTGPEQSPEDNQVSIEIGSFKSPQSELSDSEMETIYQNYLTKTAMPQYRETIMQKIWKLLST